ncbi:tRNA (adenosine(37)-N6)-threonylcarbamoyltransferase complex transferase subunit TsaD [Candidatus Solincola tengchongensis]|uniref:tRNA (adenosine(37)-N6)-threonylcarbamoyltransferase complex transferase subunit TsaD n=1 Tax=Candidatus Solincola tengchongensis TaxID=2900693 RepID=UPI0025808C6D|nr:tRNA (adenosine(37)-N6)-threonylcarbamoyltransferase complex transferase subunit TsaD [Candidatus Solincola tengchongensis]
MGTGFILGIETSCDETSAAVVERGGRMLSLVTSSQARLHRKYGGVVPEVAGRAHLEALLPVIREALSQAGIGYRDLEGVAVTRGPGLIGSLLVGLTAAKAICFALGLPLLAVNHLEAHIYANFMHFPELEPPLLSFVVSGGHTLLVHMPAHRRYRVLGETLDDAAGEAYDKIARFLGLGYPGGPEIDRLSGKGNPQAVPFPRALLHDGTYNFSLSGLKTAVINYVRRMREEGKEVCVEDVAASFQAAVVEVQVHKIVRAVEETGVRKVALAGGVAANRYLRSKLGEALGEKGAELYYPPGYLCADNAAMVAYLGWLMLEEGDVVPLDVDAAASLPLPETQEA